MICISGYTVENFPHVHGIKLNVIPWLIEALGDSGKEKFCISLNLSMCPGLGIKDSGDDWKGPRMFSMLAKGGGQYICPL